MNNVFTLIIGLIITVVGFRAFKYFDKNLDEIDNTPGKLYAIAVILIIMGLIMSITSLTIILRV